MRKITAQMADASGVRSNGSALCGGYCRTGIFAWNWVSLRERASMKYHQFATLSASGEIEKCNQGPSRRICPKSVPKPSPVNVRSHEKRIGRSWRRFIEGQDVNSQWIVRKLSYDATQPRETALREIEKLGAACGFQHQPAGSRITLRHRVLLEMRTQ